MKATTLAEFILIETERLQLAQLGPHDAVELQILTNDPKIIQAVDFLPSPFTQSDADNLIARQRGDLDRFLGIRNRNQGELVGVIGVHLHAVNEIEIGYWIGTEFQGCGFATEALCQLVAYLKRAFPSKQIIAECKIVNRASWQVLKKVGFVRAGVPGRRIGRERLINRSI